MVRILKDTPETANEATEASKTVWATSCFTLVLLFSLVLGLPFWYVFGVDLLKVLAVALTLATFTCSLSWTGDGSGLRQG